MDVAMPKEKNLEIITSARAPLKVRLNEALYKVHRWHIITTISVFAVIATSAVAYNIADSKEYLAIQTDLTSSQLNAAATMTNIGTGEWKSQSISDGFSYTLRQTPEAIASAASATASASSSANGSVSTQSLSMDATVITSPEFRLKVTAKPLESNPMPANFSLIFDYIDVSNYSYVNYAAKASAGLNGIYQVKAGATRTLATFKKFIKADTTYKAEIRKDEDDVRAYLDGSYLERVDYTSTSASKVGLGSVGGNVNFSSLELRVSGTSKPLPATPVATKPPVTTPPVVTNPVPATPEAPAPTPVPTSPSSGGKTIQVSNSAQLTAAMSSVKPGDVIKLSDGVYNAKVSIGNGAAAFASSVAGSPKAPITLQGSRNAIIEGGGVSGTYGLYLYKAHYWTISGITVRNASKGIVIDGGNFNTINGVKVMNIGEEGVHFRSFSSDNLITNSEVTATGKGKPQYGEGVYIGSATSNWGKFSGGKADTSDRNQVIGNSISNTGAESIDIKEGSTGGIIANNRFDGANMSGDNYADSWLDVKGNNYTVTGNSGVNSILDGIQVHNVVSGWGNNNVFKNNSVNVNGPGVGFNIQNKAVGTIVYCNNTVTNAKGGFGNITCRN